MEDWKYTDEELGIVREEPKEEKQEQKITKESNVPRFYFMRKHHTLYGVLACVLAISEYVSPIPAVLCMVVSIVMIVLDFKANVPMQSKLLSVISIVLNAIGLFVIMVAITGNLY